MTLRFPTSLRITVPLIMLGFAAALTAFNLLYHVPQAERAVEEDTRKRLAQELSRLQSTIEYQLVKGDDAAAQHEIEVLAHNHDVTVAALVDEHGEVVAATRRAWLRRRLGDVMPQADLDRAAGAIRARRADITLGSGGDSLLGFAGILLAGAQDELRPSRTGSLVLAYDLERYRAEARTQVLQQSLYWAGWFTALALAMWLAFHFLLTRRTARLVHAAEQFASGHLGVRSGVRGNDELGRLGRAFDAMALQVAQTQTRLQHDIDERARVQRELENSEARLQQILDNAPVTVALRDTQGNYLLVNRQWERIFGADKPERADAGGREPPPPEASRAALDSDRLVLQSDRSMEFETSVRLDDGAHTLLAVKFPLHDASGRAYAVCGIALDITERKRANEALRVSESSYRAIFNAAEDAILVHDIDTGAVVDANARACVAFGYGRDELGRLELGALGSGRSPYTMEDAQRLFHRVVAGEDIHVEWHSRNKDGEFRWREVFGKRVTIGGRDRVLSLARDIDDRKRAEQALSASEEHYRSMFNASIDGLALWSADVEIVDTNPALRRMYGYEDPPSAFPGGWPGPSYPPSFMRAVAAGRPLQIEVSARRRDGSALDLEVHGVALPYRGRPHVLTIARDITEKKRSAAELARQRESLHQREKLAALGSLLAGVAHELNNPLSVVVARSVMLEEQGDLTTQAAAAKIRAAAERCARIVRTFLAMARQRPPQRGPVAIGEVVLAALDIAAYALRSSGIEVGVDLADDTPAIHADADQLHQVLLNLVINAQQALQDAPIPRRIAISSRWHQEARQLEIRVADNGPGIPEHLRARVFEPYFTTKPTGAGTGVGLAVSFGMVEAHGGRLAVDCPAEGGAVFTVTLPVGMAPAEPEEAKPAPAVSESTRSILVIDDEPEIRDALTEILAGARHRVVAVASGHEALERMAAERYDVIFTDIRMPDLDGRALFREIELRWPAQAERVVFVTGDTLTRGLSEFISESRRPLIEKPFLPAELRRMVAELNGDAAGD
ncbi:MAG TPA: PAS domain S-box protein [Ideonella sp.]|nr:PAS domain S-box protein [Ideonella sp.]